MTPFTIEASNGAKTPQGAGQKQHSFKGDFDALMARFEEADETSSRRLPTKAATPEADIKGQQPKSDQQEAPKALAKDHVPLADASPRSLTDAGESEEITAAKTSLGEIKARLRPENQPFASQRNKDDASPEAQRQLPTAGTSVAEGLRAETAQSDVPKTPIALRGPLTGAGTTALENKQMPAAPSQVPQQEPSKMRRHPLAARPNPLAPTAQADATETNTSKPAAEITIDRRETHFQPVRRAEALEQHRWNQQLLEAVATPEEKDKKPSFTAIRDQIRTALDKSVDGETRQLQQSAPTQATPARSSAPVRILEITLQPASLGAISITMRLAGSGLRVTVAATSRETTELLTEEKDALSELIEGAGYEANEVIVRQQI